jgi:predicted nucleic acid-binding protein
MLSSGWKDYEDATQYRSAVDELADCIVTRNKKDYKASTIEVVTPSEFFTKMNSE